MNTILLTEAIGKSGLTQVEVARELGLSLEEFEDKVRTQSLGIIEANIMTELLSIENPCKVFFDREV